jgi:hypothetical protein
MQDSWWVQIFGRLRPGASESAAARSLTAALAHSIEGYAGSSPKVVKPPVYLLPGDRGVGLGREQRTTALWVLGGTVGVTLRLSPGKAGGFIL